MTQKAVFDFHSLGTWGAQTISSITDTGRMAFHATWGYFRWKWLGTWLKGISKMGMHMTMK